MNHSYWDRLIFPRTYDAVVVGAGIVGLSAAYHLKQEHPNWQIAVLERGLTTAGASTKNAGFACFGSLSEIVDDLFHMDESQVIDLIRERWEGLKYLSQLTSTYDIGYQNNGGFELFSSTQGELYERCMSQIDSINAMMKSNFGQSVFSSVDHRIDDFGFSGTDHLLINPFEGQIDTGKLMMCFTDLCRKAGIYLIFGAAVNRWAELNSNIALTANDDIELTTKHLVIATNGFAKELLPDIDVQPTRAQCLITERIDQLKVQGTFHMDRGYYYFRNIDNRILLGGARQLDQEREFTSSTDTTQKIQDELERVLSEIILPHRKVQIDQRWTGTMGTGPSKQPIVERFNERIIIAVRLAGMGIAIGSRIGQNAARMVHD